MTIHPPSYDEALPGEPFWMVFCLTGHSPKFRHSSFASAQCEARRLALCNSGKVFVVLEAIEAIQKRDFDVIRFRKPPSDDTPF